MFFFQTGDNDAVTMHETDCKEDQSDNDVIFVRHTHGKTGKRLLANASLKLKGMFK